MNIDNSQDAHEVGPTLFVCLVTAAVMIGLLYTVGVVASVIGGIVTLAMLGVMFNER